MLIKFNNPQPLHDFIRKKQFSNRLDTENEQFSGAYFERCLSVLPETKAVFMTPSCTSALEFCALLAEIGPRDEVIVPSYTFSSTANMVALRGATPVFVDCDASTKNITVNTIESAITPCTRAIIVVHYAGVSCEMEEIMELANAYSLLVIEDAAHGVGSYYGDKPLGTIGDFGAYSFHSTKNIICGEGGALLVNRARFVESAEIVREKGTNRSKFLRGEVDKYTWQQIGSSPIISEICAEYLLPQFISLQEITENRLETWNFYKSNLREITELSELTLPTIPDNCSHNGHLFSIILPVWADLDEFIHKMKEDGVQVASHYVPLHSSPAGCKFGRFCGDMKVTNQLHEKLVRLPMYYGITPKELEYILDRVRWNLLQLKP